MNLSEFLLARIAEDEEVARESHYEGQHWLTEEEGVYRWPDDELAHMADRKADARHIARWDPARVLAECEAKRRIVGYVTPSDEFEQGLLRAFADPAVDATALAQVEPFARLLGAQINQALSDVLRLLALPYADHPDYDEAWRP